MVFNEYYCLTLANWGKKDLANFYPSFDDFFQNSGNLQLQSCLFPFGDTPYRLTSPSWGEGGDALHSRSPGQSASLPLPRGCLPAMCSEGNSAPGKNEAKHTDLPTSM